MAGLTRVRKPLFTQEWVEALAPVAESGMTATIRIYELDGEPTYDPDTGQYTTPEIEHYVGKSRVQPLRSVRTALLPGNDTGVQSVQFQIPIEDGKDFDLRPRMKVLVTACVLNPVLTAYAYQIQEIVDSSNPFERTFVCAVNTETEV